MNYIVLLTIVTTNEYELYCFLAIIAANEYELCYFVDTIVNKKYNSHSLTVMIVN
jgi:hypothetical protein